MTNDSTRATSEIDEYDYDLPRELIAQHPLTNRSDARMLVVNRAANSIEHSHVRDLADFLESGDTLVINETKVIAAKLAGFKKATGGRWHGLCLDHDENGNIKLLCKTRGRLNADDRIVIQDRDGAERCELVMLARLDGGAWIAKPMIDDGQPFDFEAFLKQHGRVPLPHYIRDGNMTDADFEHYQTVYAKKPGSIAVPTAGLHFNNTVINRLIDRGILICKVTLHVGLGTFRPVTAATLDEHKMHFESGWIEQSAADQLNQARARGSRVIAVGTTSVRLLESSYRGKYESWTGDTDLFIRPPYEFQAVDGMMTNFHLPRTTLLVLARTFGGDELIRRAYREAIDESYRFFSYGDSMLIV